MDEIAIRNWNDRVLFVLLLVGALGILAWYRLRPYRHLKQVSQALGLISIMVALNLLVWVYFTFFAFARLP